MLTEPRAARRTLVFVAALAIASAGASGCGNSGNNEAAGTSSGAGGQSTTTSSSTGTASSTGAGGSDAGTCGVDAGSSTVTGVSGGTLDTLRFAIVGDTRPPMIDDVGGYPTSTITKIWQQVEAACPRPPFAISTGDYMYTDGSTAATQVGIYLTARKSFSNVVFPAMGNHECNGYTDSNCGPCTPDGGTCSPDGGPTVNVDGITPNYTQFMTQMLGPLGVTTPYYTVSIGANDGSWTAKFVIIAANAWDDAQATWFDAQLAVPTTYTFVVRHEGTDATTAPGVTPSAQIMVNHPYTLLIAGHTHKFEYEEGAREVIVGNGGAPLSSSSSYYGYVIATQRASDGAMVFSSYDSSTNAVVQTFAVTAAGAPTN